MLIALQHTRNSAGSLWGLEIEPRRGRIALWSQNIPELFAIAAQLLAIYCTNISASDRALCTCDAESKRESRNAGAV